MLNQCLPLRKCNVADIFASVGVSNRIKRYRYVMLVTIDFDSGPLASLSKTTTPNVNSESTRTGFNIRSPDTRIKYVKLILRWLLWNVALPIKINAHQSAVCCEYESRTIVCRSELKESTGVFVVVPVCRIVHVYRMAKVIAIIVAFVGEFLVLWMEFRSDVAISPHYPMWNWLQQFF
jgi:hypothetical protein